MKKILLCLMMATALMACDQKKANTVTTYTTDGADIRFKAPTFDFGKIKQGEKVTHSFTFTNLGKAPLIVTNAVASCGCTTPVWPKTPVLPGDSAAVSVTFNSATKSGLQDKLITVTSNSQPAQCIVHLIGEVLTK